MSNQEYKTPLPDPTKGDRETFREVITEWRDLCFKYTDQIVVLKAEIKELKSNDTKN